MADHLELRRGDSACLFAWAEEDERLRRMDEDKTYPDDLVQEVHEDGEIFTGACKTSPRRSSTKRASASRLRREVHATGGPRLRMFMTVLASNQYLSPAMSLPDAAAAFLLANEAELDSADEELITEDPRPPRPLGGGGNTHGSQRGPAR